MLIRQSTDIPASAITPEAVFRQRRTLLKALGFAGSGALLSQAAAASLVYRHAAGNAGEALTPEADVTQYNNFYELGMGKDDPAANAAALRATPWSVVVEGEVGKPGTYTLEYILQPQIPLAVC